MMVSELQAVAESLDWEFRENVTSYATHNIHRYSGKFIPQIARQAIELISQPGETILDPYCGSGTTLLEALSNGRNAIGYDLNPVAQLISRVKIRPVDTSAAFSFLESTTQQLRSLHSSSMPLFECTDVSSALTHQVHEDWRWKDDWFVKWFQDQPRFDLIAISKLLEKEPNDSLRDIGLVALSNVLRRSSNANGSYPNVMFDKNKREIKSVLPIFIEQLNQITNAVVQLNTDAYQFPEGIRATTEIGDATSLPLEDESINAVVTHPPYIGSIPYAEYNSLSLRWLGYDSKVLDSKLTGGKRQSKYVVDRFRKGYSLMLSESYRVLKPNRCLFLMVGNPVVKGKLIDLAQMSVELATSIGFNLQVQVHRNGVNRRSNQMGKETLLFFNKHC